MGPVSARIFVRTGRRYADLFVRVCDVDAEGVSRNIVDGIRRLSPQTVAALAHALLTIAADDEGVPAQAPRTTPVGRVDFDEFPRQLAKLRLEVDF